MIDPSKPSPSRSGPGVAEISVVFGIRDGIRVFFAVITGKDGEVKASFGPYSTAAQADKKASELGKMGDGNPLRMN